MVKKHISKKITVLFVSVVICVMSCMTVFAGDIGFDSEHCSNCGVGSVWVSDEYEGKYTTGVEKKCSHHKYGTDLEIAQHYILHYECINCGWIGTGGYDTYYWQCHGYDGPDNN